MTFEEQQISIPYAKGSATSKAAADRIKGHAAKQRSLVLGWIMNNPGCTDEEIAEGLGIGSNSCRPRRIELLRLGLIEECEEKGRTKAGRAACVWRINGSKTEI